MVQLDMFRRGRSRTERIAGIEAKRPAGKELSIEARWKAFRATHPHVFDRALELARDKLAKKEKRVSVAAIWEGLRGKVGVPLDNTHRAPLARALLAAEPRLHGVLETRQRRTP